MDPRRFDSLSRDLGRARSRRSALAAVFGSALVLLGLAETTAKHKKKHHKKKHSPPPVSPPPESPSPPSPPPPVACGSSSSCVFVSSALYSGALGGLSGADSKCQGLAAAAGLPGSYKAWLADTTGAPISRFVHSTGPYRLVNGTTIAANWTDLA